MSERSLTISTAADAGVRRVADFLERLFPAPRGFEIRLWDGSVVGATGAPRFTLALLHPGSLRRMLRPPVELSMGEAYLRRDFDIEGDLPAAFDLMHTARAVLRSPGGALDLALRYLALPRAASAVAPLAPRAPARLSGAEHSPSRDRAAIRYHYDVGNDFYRLFLDRRMVYSCAYFPTGAEDIDAAQEAKLELICRKLRLREGERLLDIGCGWGGLLIYAAQRYGVTGTGITLSEEQFRLARARVAEAGLEERVRVERRDYREIDQEEFDKIVSVGMFEHVGRRRFADYFAQAHRLLRPGGLFLNHAISNRPEPPRKPLLSRALDSLVVGNFTFRKRYIFPDGELVPVSEANLVAERAGFEVRDVENLREHYALTLRRWLDRLRRHRDRAVALAGEPVFRLWEMYLAGSIYHFETGRISVNQTLLAKPADGRCALPLTRADLYGGSGQRSAVSFPAREGRGGGALRADR